MCDLGDRLFAGLSGLSPTWESVRLNLKHNLITNRGATALGCTLGRCARLRRVTVNLSYNAVTGVHRLLVGPATNLAGDPVALRPAAHGSRQRSLEGGWRRRSRRCGDGDSQGLTRCKH